MKIAVVGAGVSGLVAARRLTQQGHDVSIFEAGDRWGGHAESVSLDTAGAGDPIDVGFLVFNEAACPRLTDLLAELRTPTQEIRMSFEVRHAESNMVLRGGSLRELFAVPRNWTAPPFYRVVHDWIRFTRHARRELRTRRESRAMTLREFLDAGRYGDAFVEQFVYPLAGAVFPLCRAQLAETPLSSLVGFIHNHGLLKLTSGRSCRRLAEGSRGYLHRLTDGIRERIQVNCPVAAIARHDDYVVLKFPNRLRERYEQVVMAVHADVALRLLADHTRVEREVLESFDYAPQNVYVHLEDARRAPPDSVSWRFQTSDSGRGDVALSYGVSRVQGVDAPQSLMLTTLGADHPPPPQVLRTVRCRRPVFSKKSLIAQRRFAQINGRRRTYYCGSYWGHGFHEDSIRSAEDVAQLLSRSAVQVLALSG